MKKNMRFLNRDNAKVEFLRVRDRIDWRRQGRKEKRYRILKFTESKETVVSATKYDPSLRRDRG